MKKTPRIIVYESSNGWYWTLRARNGERVADGCEAYAKRANALRAAKRTQAIMAAAEIVVQDPPK